MGAEIIKVDYDALKKVSAELANSEDRCKSSNQKILKGAEQLRFAGKWEGQGAATFYREMENEIFPTFHRLIASLESATRTVDEISRIFQKAEQEASGLFTSATEKTESNLALPGNLQPIEIIHLDGHHEHFLISGLEYREYQKFLSGNLSYQELVDELFRDPFENELVESKITIWDKEASAQLVGLDGRLSGSVGDLWGGLGVVEGTGAAAFTIEDGLEAKIRIDAGVYAAKGTYTKEIGALSIAALAFAGANVTDEIGSAFNPFQGDARVKGKVDAFAGVKAEAETGLASEIAGVDVSGKVHGGISAGVGIIGNLDVGIDDWNLKIEAEAGCALGVGAELGLSFEMDIKDVVENIVDIGKIAAEPV